VEWVPHVVPRPMTAAVTMRAPVRGLYPFDMSEGTGSRRRGSGDAQDLEATLVTDQRDLRARGIEACVDQRQHLVGPPGDTGLAGRLTDCVSGFPPGQSSAPAPVRHYIGG